MGDEKEQKPKIDGKKAGGQKWGNNKKQGGGARPKKEKFKAPTPGMEDDVFTVGGAKDAANFIDVKKRLSRWVGVNFKVGGQMAQVAIEDLVAPVIKPPEDLKDKATKMEEKKWELEYEKYYKQSTAWEDAEARAFQLVLSHCNTEVEEKIASSSKWEEIKRDHKLVELLQLIRAVVHKHDEVKQGTMALVEQQLNLYVGYQKPEVPLMDFYKQFKAKVDIINVFGGQAGFHSTVYEQHRKSKADALGTEVAKLTAEQKKECLQSSCQEFLSALFIRISNDDIHKEVKDELDNMYLFNYEAYPKTLEDAYRYLLNYKPVGSRKERNSKSGGGNPKVNEESVAFVQSGKQKEKTEKSKFNTGDPKNDPCYNCGEDGHIAKNCPSLTQKEKEEVDLVGSDHFNAFLQECTEGINNTSIGLDDDSIQTAGSIEFIGDDDFDIYETHSDRDAETPYGDAFGFIEPSSKPPVRVDCGRNRLYLDSCATENVMFAEEFLSRCHTTGVVMRQNCNAGSKLTTRMGFWCGIKFWINPDGIANLLSIPKLQQLGFKVQFTDKWRVLTPNKKVITFKQDIDGVCRGMPYVELDKIKHYISKADESVTFVETVRRNYEGFTAEQVKRAKEARDAMAMMAHPTSERFMRMVSSNVIKNCNFTSADVANANALFGPDRGAIRGKTVRQRPGKVRPEYCQIPLTLYERLRDVTLTGDVMFVNGLPFFMTLSRGIKLGTAEFTPSRTADQLHQKLEKVVRFYRRGGFLVRTVLMDMEFEPLADLSTSTLVNCTAAREHVGDIERFIRTVRERCRSTTSELPYKEFMPDQFVIRLVYFAVTWINAFIAENGASTEYSPREIVTGLIMDFKKQCRARWGSYVEASEDAIVTNTQDDRTQPGICLGPVGNFQGSTWVYNLVTKKVVKRRTITPLPMPDRVIRRITALGKQSKQKRTADRLQFLNRHQERFSWDNEELDEPQLVETGRPTDHLLAEIPGVLCESDIANPTTVQPEPTPTELEHALAAQTNANLDDSQEPIEITGVDDDEVEPPAPVVTDVEDEDSSDEEEDDESTGQDSDHEEIDAPSIASEDNEADNEDSESESEEEEEEVQPRRSQRLRKPTKPITIDYENRAYQLSDGVLHINPAVVKQSKQSLKITSTDITGVPLKSNRVMIRSPPTAGITPEALSKLGMPALPPQQEVHDHVVMQVMGIILAEQYSINKGIRLFGDRAKESISKELMQLHSLQTYRPVHAKELTQEQKRQALASLIFLTEKRCGRIKTRACVNGSAQRDYIPKETAASPTVMNDSVMITSAIDAHEGRRVVTCDIPGAFLHADLDEEVIMLLRGQLADLMVQVDPELYGPYLIKSKKGESLLYVRMLKAMYGLLRSALLFYLKLVADLQEYGFKLNPYDPCVANMVVDGSQMTVTWHVDDLKISHRDQKVIDDLLGFLKSKYGDGLVVHTGDIHDYLGVDHDYSEKGVVKLSMIKHLEKVFEDFPEDIGKSASTPAADHLFQVRDPEEALKEGKLLSPTKAKEFHHSVAQLLFISTRTRRDIQTVVSFLTTRVKKPDEDDWGKLKRLLKYLKGTKHMKLVLCVDSLGTVMWWVDASYNVHEDCRGHTGAMMSMGKGAQISFSRKQKLNVRSSCEGELVGIDDALPVILWARYFIEAQGYSVEQNILYQDNKSTILLANNGRWSSSKRTKHIKSRYFFIKDKVDSGEVSIEHRPTDKMWSDVLTKPKQGKGFRVDRSWLMNCDEDYDDEKERLRTHPKLLPAPVLPVDPKTVAKPIGPITPGEGANRRSVLGEERNSATGRDQNRSTDRPKLVTWNMSHERVDRGNVKARKLHLEVVKARVLRAKMYKRQLGKE